MRVAAFALIAAAVLAACASGAPVPPAERQPPLPPMFLDLALSEAAENDGGTRAQFLALLGREDLFAQPSRHACPAHQVDPVEEIVRQSLGRRLVIINEAHEQPQHRAFIAQVAAALRREGFSIYAAETLLPLAREERAWPSADDGTYSREPIFGALLRDVRALGYRLFEYEDLSTFDESLTQAESIARREATQARNVQRILENNPEARVLLHVGHAHLLEQPDAQGNVWMAQRLKQATGIDPLTIDLTRYASANSDFAMCDPVHTPSTNVDIRVASPAVSFENGRPAWRQHAGHEVTPIPARLVNPRHVTIIEARLWDEPDDAVPVDRVLLHPGETLPLLLPPGRYRVESWTQGAGWSAPVEISVD
jgi:hypothetical protein